MKVPADNYEEFLENYILTISWKILEIRGSDEDFDFFRNIWDLCCSAFS